MPDPRDSELYEGRLEAVLESITDGFYALDADWRMVIFNRAAEVYFGVDRAQVIGRNLWDLFPQGVGTDYERICRAAMDQGISGVAEAPSRLRPDRVVELRVSPMRGGGIAVALTDVTERRQAEDRQRLLINELNHRVKNALATVQAIAAQSLRGDDVSPEARARFMDRLFALAQASDLLVVESWEGASLEAVARQVASPFAEDVDARRFSIAGAPVRLSPNTATAMALALHELATNAAKYGALSRPEGRVELSWGVDDGRFRLIWREAGGPPVTPPTRSGFGTRLIGRGLTTELNGEVSMDYAPGGLVCTVTAPVTEGLAPA